ncbi:MAG: hypothetical protein AABY83_13055 [Pseudomonadota bacterium]
MKKFTGLKNHRTDIAEKICLHRSPWHKKFKSTDVCSAFRTRVLLFVTMLASGGCTHAPPQDPLHNTKKLVTEGHASLYRNGAFQVPATTMYLIPPGPDALSLALELAGIRAAQSFQTSLQHARESVEFAKLGIDKSLTAAQQINTATEATAASAREFTLRGAQYAAQAPNTTRSIVGASIEFATHVHDATKQAGGDLAEGALQSAQATRQTSQRFAAKTLQTGVADAATDARKGVTRAQQRAHFAAERFIKGYAAVPKKLAQRVDDVAASTSFAKFSRAMQRATQWRSETTTPLTDILVDTTAHYGDDVKSAFNNAHTGINEGAQDIGYTLAMLKSLRWVLQGILWEATIKPAGKLAAASLGYVAVNAVAFPALITINEGVAVANIAVEVSWNSAGAAYDIVAPSAVAALVGLYGAVEFAGSEALTTGKLALNSTLAAGAYTGGQGLGAATAVGGYTAGKTVQYIGAPLAALGVAGIGTTVGVIAGGAKVAEGGLAMTGGGIAEVGTQVAGKTAAATVAVGGSTLAVVAGGALGTYELSKAVVAPVGYELGGGLVLSYGTLAQLSAQSVLAVSDAAYVVLSLEGPRWVLYAVKGNLDKGEQLPTGSMLDLKAMQNAGEEFYVVPASGEEMQRVVDSVYKQLPQIDFALPEAAE